MCRDIAINILSDFIFLLIIIASGWVLFVFTHRSRLLRFYGIDTSRRIIIYLSNLRVVSGGAIGIDNIHRSYEGSAAAFGEMQVANSFRDLFNYFLPSLSDTPGLLSKLLISDVQIQMLPSPLDQGQIEPSCSFIALGSPAYNAASGFVEKALRSQAQFGQMEQNRLAMCVGEVPPIFDLTYGFVERIVDREQQRCIFYAAGLSELGTVGAAHFLSTEWSRLHRRYGNDTDFVVMLRFESIDFRRWSIVFER